MRNEWMSRTSRWVAILLLCRINVVLLAAPVQAAVHTPQAAADTVTLTLDNPGTTFIYGQTPVPTFTAVVTFGTKPAANHFWGITGHTDDGASFGSNSPTTSPDGMTLTFTNMTVSLPINVGSRTATANFTNLETSMTATSNPVTFTVNQATTLLSCSIDGNAERFEGVGQTLHVRMAPTTYHGQVPVDWQNGTYTVTFDGPDHITFPNLAPDSNDEVTVPGLSQNGKYLLSCAFSGTPSFTSATFTYTLAYTFSAEQSPSSVQLFTNPTTLVARQNLDFYIVFHPAPGLPTPTGAFQIWMGQYYTDSLQLSPKGDYLIHLYPLPSVTGINQISIRYWGDIYYNEANFNFPLTNPAIPGSSSGSSGSSGTQSSGTQWQATATTSTTGTPGATSTADATPTVVGAGVVPPAATPPTGNSGIFWLIGGLVLLILAGLGTTAGIMLYRTRRAKSPPGAFPVHSPAPPSSDATQPFSHYDS